MKIPVIPDAFDGLPNSTKLYTREVLNMFGYSRNYTISVAVESGSIPQPKQLNESGNNFFGGRMHYWTLGSIRRLRIKMLEELDK